MPAVAAVEPLDGGQVALDAQASSPRWPPASARVSLDNRQATGSPHRRRARRRSRTTADRPQEPERPDRNYDIGPMAWRLIRQMKLLMKNCISTDSERSSLVDFAFAPASDLADCNRDCDSYRIPHTVPGVATTIPCGKIRTVADVPRVAKLNRWISCPSFGSQTSRLSGSAPVPGERESPRRQRPCRPATMPASAAGRESPAARIAATSPLH